MGASVEEIKAGLNNGSALLDAAVAENARTHRGIEELPLEDLAEKLAGVATALGVAAAKLSDFPIGEGQARRGQAEGQYDHTFERTGRHPDIDHLYSAVGAMGQQYNQAGDRQEMLHDKMAGWCSAVAGIAHAIMTEGIGLRTQIEEHVGNADAYAKRAQQDGENYRNTL